MARTNQTGITNNEQIKIQYQNKLKDPRWQKKRLEIFNRDNFTCTLCGDDKHTLNVHHTEYAKSGQPWDVDNSSLKTLCEKCHFEVEIALKHNIKYIKICKITGHKYDSLLCLSEKNTVHLRIYNKENILLHGFEIDEEKLNQVDYFIQKYKERLR